MREGSHFVVLLRVQENVREGTFLQASGSADAAVRALAQILAKCKRKGLMDRRRDSTSFTITRVLPWRAKGAAKDWIGGGLPFPGGTGCTAFLSRPFGPFRPFSHFGHFRKARAHLTEIFRWVVRIRAQ